MDSDRGGRAPGQASPGQGGAPSGSAALEQDFDASSLYVLRSAVGAHAAAAGLATTRVYDVVAVAHELAANAVRHGAGRGRLRLWTVGGALHCQVSDDGPATADGGADGGQPPWPAEHGHGLWVVGQVADEFSISSGPAGTTATAAFGLDPAR